jgi:N-acetylglucosamine-6-phosphate deacetylase
MPSQGAITAIDAALLFDGERFLTDYSVILAGDTIERVVPLGDRPDDLEATALAGGILAPGLVDLQVNGGGGVLLNNDPTRAGVAKIAAAHRALGTTALLPTVMSDAMDVQQAAVEAVMAARDAGCSAIAGIHIEGPFFERSRRGAHRADRIRSPAREDLDWLCSLGSRLPVMLTLAPETVDTPSIRRLYDSGIVLCAGHTNARFDQMRAAAEAGLAGVTHLYNAMSQVSAREPGTVGAALGDDRLWAGVIADGHHVHPANIRTAARAKPPGKLLLVSDAMATVGGDGDRFELYGETLTARDGRLVNGDGVLAGSAISLMDAVRFVAETVGLPLAECLRMASRYPASVIGHGAALGRIAPGYRADLVHFDDGFRVRRTWCAGGMQEHGA